MKRALIHRLSQFALAVGVLGIGGCFRGPKAYDPSDSQGRKVFGVAVRPYAPQPVYKRTTLVHLPSPLPPEAGTSATAPLMLPVIQLDLEDATLEEAANTLGKTARYSAYCASTIADRRISLRTLGTVDELALRIASEAKIHAVVDHHNREVRFMARQAAVEPKLAEPKVSDSKLDDRR